MISMSDMRFFNREPSWVVEACELVFSLLDSCLHWEIGFSACSYICSGWKGSIVSLVVFILLLFTWRCVVFDMFRFRTIEGIRSCLYVVGRGFRNVTKWRKWGNRSKTNAAIVASRNPGDYWLQICRCFNKCGVSFLMRCLVVEFPVDNTLLRSEGRWCFLFD